MTKHSQRDVRGRFARVDPERDVLAPGLGVPDDYAYGMEHRYAPSADGESEPGGARSPHEITDAQGPEAWAAPYADAFPSPVPHDPARGPYQRPLPHRQQVVIDAQTGQQVSDHITDVRAVRSAIGGRTATHVVTVDGTPDFWSESIPEKPEYPATMRRLPPMGQGDRY
jgi:hypothetical protein